MSSSNKKEKKKEIKKPIKKESSTEESEEDQNNNENENNNENSLTRYLRICCIQCLVIGCMLLFSLLLVLTQDPYYNMMQDYDYTDLEDEPPAKPKPDRMLIPLHVNSTDFYLNECAYPPLLNPRNLTNLGEICIIVRTYSAHLQTIPYSIRRIMTCLEQMEYPYWQMYFFSTNENPIDEIEQLILERNKTYQSKYHYLKYDDLQPYGVLEGGYKATDWAIAQCSPEAKWLLVTNGDNEYSPQTLSFLENTKDAYSFDFFSRYNKVMRTINLAFLPSDMGPEIFPNDKERCALLANSCAMNLLVITKTDLGSIIWNITRWRAENMTYSSISPHCCHDGVFTENAVKKGWVIRRIPLCLFSHSPNDWSFCRHNFTQVIEEEEKKNLTRSLNHLGE